VVVARLQATDGDDIDVAAEQFGQLVLKMEKVEQRAVRFELDEEVDIAAVIVFSASY
jgi:hypothetical protein